MEKELLEELLSQEKTLSQISEITGKGKTTIRYWIAQHQLERIKNTNCEVCQALLTGKQRNFCSVKCRMKTTNFKHQVYTCQQARGLERKKQLIEIAGGECCDCGYKKNISALEFHHLNPKEKSFGIDLRKCSCAKWESLVEEVKKCVLICANCHRERHNPDLIL
jgi:5-methylcytosine-specific restriction endonuclease McrA